MLDPWKLPSQLRESALIFRSTDGTKYFTSASDVLLGPEGISPATFFFGIRLLLFVLTTMARIWGKQFKPHNFENISIYGTAGCMGRLGGLTQLQLAILSLFGNSIFPFSSFDFRRHY
jgi:hypothetical protein